MLGGGAGVYAWGLLAHPWTLRALESWCGWEARIKQRCRVGMLVGDGFGRLGFFNLEGYIIGRDPGALEDRFGLTWTGLRLVRFFR